MATRLRRILKTTGWSIGGVLLLVIVFVGLLAFPGFMFAHSVSYSNVTAYSDDDSVELTPILRKIHARIATSPIYVPTTEHSIFFGHGKRFFGFVQSLRAKLVQIALGMKPSLTYNASWPPHLSQVITFRNPDFGKGKLGSD
jgi:hypothetical protein